MICHISVCCIWLVPSLYLGRACHFSGLHFLRGPIEKKIEPFIYENFNFFFLYFRSVNVSLFKICKCQTCAFFFMSIVLWCLCMFDELDNWFFKENPSEYFMRYNHLRIQRVSIGLCCLRPRCMHHVIYQNYIACTLVYAYIFFYLFNIIVRSCFSVEHVLGIDYSY